MTCKRLSLIEQNKDFILFLNKLNGKDRKKVLSVLGGNYIKTISEIFLNFLKQNLTTDGGIIKKIFKYKKEVRKVSTKSVPVSKKREILKGRKGGAILSVLLPLAASIVTSLIARKK